MTVEINPKLLDVVQFEDSSLGIGRKFQGTVVDSLGEAPRRVLIELSNEKGIPLAFVARPADEVATVWQISELTKAQSDIPAAQQFFENGILYLQNGLIPRAKEHLDRAFSIDPDLARSLLNSTNLLAESGAFNAAIVVYKMLLELQPGYDLARENLAITHINRGIEAARHGFIGQAIEDFNHALMLRPSEATVEAVRRNIVAAYTQLGIRYSEIKQYREAGQCFQWALELHPSEIPRKNLALAMIALSTVETKNRTREAREEVFRQPLLMGLTLSECLNAYGATLASLGEFSEAGRALELAIEADPRNEIAQKNLDRLSRQEPHPVLLAGLVAIEIRTPHRLRS